MVSTRARAVLLFALAAAATTDLSGCSRPSPAPSPSASAATTPPVDAGAIDAGAVDDAEPTFSLVIDDIDRVLSFVEGVFPLENGILVLRRDRLVAVSGPMMALSDAQLHAGLPPLTDPVHKERITGVTGRFPDAAFLTVSRSLGWGAGELYRYDVDRWVPVEGSQQQNGYVAGAGVAAGPALVIEQQDFISGSHGFKRILPLLKKPIPRDPLRSAIKTKVLSSGFVASLPDGNVFVCADEQVGDTTTYYGSMEHFSPGSRIPVIHRLPFYPEAAFARSRDDVYAVGRAGEKQDEPGFAHFDGRAWTPMTPPPVRGSLESITGLADGSLFVVARASSRSALWRRSPEGAWTEVSTRFRKGADAPEPERVFVSAGVLYVYAESENRCLLLADRRSAPTW